MTLSIDIGGTKISSGIISENFNISKFKKINVPQSKDKFLKIIVNLIQEYQKEYKIKKIAVGCAGLIDETGTIIKSPNLDFLTNFKLKDFIKKSAQNIETKVSNDVQCFTIAESILGAGKNYNIVIGITIGTGLGGGICINKKYFKGSQNFAGEFGHTIINTGFNKQCKCGNCGCLEQFVSGKAIEKYYQKISGEKKSAEEIGGLSRKNDKKALETIHKTAQYLGIGLANLSHILNPDAIIIGGSISKIEALFNPAIKSMHLHLISDKIKTNVIPSQLEDGAILIGASLL